MFIRDSCRIPRTMSETYVFIVGAVTLQVSPLPKFVKTSLAVALVFALSYSAVMEPDPEWACRCRDRLLGLLMDWLVRVAYIRMWQAAKAELASALKVHPRTVSLGMKLLGGCLKDGIHMKSVLFRMARECAYSRAYDYVYNYACSLLKPTKP